MDLDKSFRRLVFVQVLLGVVAFCIAERNPGLMLIAGALTVLSRYVTEGPASWRMPRWLLNLLALMTVGSLVGELGWQRGNVVVAMGHFTMWLQILLMYVPRSNRDYGQILVLSLMLMIGASILSVSMVFGALLAAYCGLGLWTVLRFHLKATVDQVILANRQAAPTGTVIPTPKAVIGRGYRWHFRIMAVVIALICAATAVAVFVVMPRTGKSHLPSHLTDSIASTQAGFNNQIDLTTNPPRDAAKEPVLNMYTTRQGRNTGSPARFWLLRGAALDHYNPKTQTWRRVDAQASDTRLPPERNVHTLAGSSPQNRSDSQAQITLRQPGYRQFFTLFPVGSITLDNRDPMQFSPLDRQVTLDQSIAKATAYTVSFSSTPDEQIDAAYRAALQKRILASNASTRPYARMWSVQRNRIAALAQQIIAEQGLTRDPALPHTPDDAAIAQALAEHLRQDYHYSLQNPLAARNEDPIIEFLFQHRTGHCELFASALVAMCRSINIPARMITGYRAGEYNRIGGYYVVRQNNAHAWCEVDFGPGIGWHTLDPTPPDPVAAEHQVATGWLRTAQEIYDYFEFRWIQTVVAYDAQTRDQVISEIGQTAKETLQSKTSWFGRAIAFLADLPNIWRLDRTSYTLAGVILIMIGVAVASLIRTLVVRRRRLAALQLTALPRHRRRGLSRKLRFYLQMLDLLERHGHQRPHWQCPYHFAENLVGLDPQRFDPVLQLTESFYEIRFGHRDPSPTRLTRIRDNLRQLEQALGRGGRD